MKIQCTAEISKITPEIASEWLAERWPSQRSVRAAAVARLAADMEAGRFKISPDAILRVKGKLANGQHRLEAIVKSGKAQTFIVMESNDEELYRVTDAGLRRTAGDGLIGIHFGKSMPSIARWVLAYETQSLFRSARCGSEAANNACASYRTQSELIAYCEENQIALGDAAKFVNPLYDKTHLLPLSIGGAVCFIGEKYLGKEKTEAFLREVYIGGANSAACDLRNKLISNMGNRAKLSAGYIFGITLKSLKSYCNGTRPGVLKWAKDEAFPTL